MTQTETKVTVDIGAAMQMLDASPELAQAMNELIVGPMVASELAGLQEMVGELVSSLKGALPYVERVEATSPTQESGVRKQRDAHKAAVAIRALLSKIGAKAPA